MVLDHRRSQNVLASISKVALLASSSPTTSLLRLMVLSFIVVLLPHWATAGECLPSSTDLLSYHCFSNIVVAESSTDATNTGVCADTEEQCANWASSGECRANPGYMRVHCRQSCQTCLDGHGGSNTQIAPDAETRLAVAQRLAATTRYLQGQVDIGTGAMLGETCRNSDARCTLWAVQGECDANANFMQDECAAACHRCH